jgi:hypothetical protein
MKRPAGVAFDQLANIRRGRIERSDRPSRSAVASLEEEKLLLTVCERADTALFSAPGAALIVLKSLCRFRRASSHRDSRRCFGGFASIPNDGEIGGIA